MLLYVKAVVGGALLAHASFGSLERGKEISAAMRQGSFAILDNLYLLWFFLWQDFRLRLTALGDLLLHRLLVVDLALFNSLFQVDVVSQEGGDLGGACVQLLEVVAASVGILDLRAA